jgi:hypothetical protein
LFNKELYLDGVNAAPSVRGLGNNIKNFCMAKHVQLSVDNPCHENWENMSPSEKGRFCGSCQKQVVDFTGMTDAQIAMFFKKPATGSVCGRFMQDQLERDFEIPRKRIPWIKYFFTVALPAFLVSRTAAQEIKSSIKGDTTAVVSCDRSPVLMGKIAYPGPHERGPVSIRGRVLDNAGTPIAGASVVVKGTTIGTAADTDGNFSFTNLNTKGDIVLIASAIGYNLEEIKVNSSNSTADIRLELQQAVMGDIVVVGMISPRRAKKKKVPVINELAPDSTSKFVKAYPNPVIAGDPISIQCRKMAKGDYSFELINMAGQMVQYKEMRIENEKQSLQLNTPLVKPGTYFLKITNKATRKSLTDKIVIEE